MAVAEWIQQEMSTVDFGDKRLNKRLKITMNEQYEKPQSTSHGAAKDSASAKANQRLKKTKKLIITD